jgi:hypothetical protein
MAKNGSVNWFRQFKQNVGRVPSVGGEGVSLQAAGFEVRAEGSLRVFVVMWADLEVGIHETCEVCSEEDRARMGGRHGRGEWVHSRCGGAGGVTRQGEGYTIQLSTKCGAALGLEGKECKTL